MIVLRNAKIRASNSLWTLSFRNRVFVAASFLINYNGEVTRNTYPHAHPKMGRDDRWRSCRWQNRLNRLYFLFANIKNYLDFILYPNWARSQVFPRSILSIEHAPKSKILDIPYWDPWYYVGCSFAPHSDWFYKWWSISYLSAWLSYSKNWTK